MTTDLINSLGEKFSLLLAEAEKLNKTRFDGLKEMTALALSSADKAVNKAEDATNKRFDSVNEFRKSLDDSRVDLLPRQEFAAQHESLKQLIASVESRVAKNEALNAGKQSGIGMVGVIVLGIITAIASVTTIVSFLAHPTAQNNAGQIQADTNATISALIAQNAALIAKMGAGKEH